MNIDWKTKSRQLPWICGLKTYNSDPTIYACLQAAYKLFDEILITDDGSTDRTLEEVERFSSDFPEANIGFCPVGDWDPIPELSMERDHGGDKAVGSHPLHKSHAKSQIKNWATVKRYFPESIYFSLEDDVLLYPDIKERIQKRIEAWEDPMTDCEYFNTIFIINDKHVRLANPDAGMRRRTDYENAGDWTFACFYTSSHLTVGPDPVNPWGACMFPWLQKNQCGKKGQDNSPPFALHMIYFRRSRDGFNLEDGWKRVGKIADLNDNFVDTKIMGEYDLKINVKINNDASLSIVDRLNK
jgi:glycosyltransferase involved in cell wall biosynthesis